MAFFRCSSGGGSGGDSYVLSKTGQMQFTDKKGTLTGLTAGKEYMFILSFGWSNANTGTNCQLASITNTTDLTLVNGGTVEYNGTQYCYTAWCIYTFKATGTSGTVTKSTTPSGPNARYYLFEKV